MVKHNIIYTLSGRRSHVRGSLSAASLVICSPHCTLQYVELRGYCPVQGGGATSQLDLPSLTPLSVSSYGRLQLGAPHYATSLNYCKQLIIEPTFCGSRFSTAWEAPGHRRLYLFYDIYFYEYTFCKSLYMLLTWSPHVVYHGDPIYILY